jgi:sirohydrochlorin ferrochelatase
MMNAVLLVSHGSRLPQTKKEVSQLVNQLKKNKKAQLYHYAFLEIVSPSIPEGIKYCVRKGAKKIVVLLNFLNSGRHVDQDIPEIIKNARQEYPHVRFQISKPVGQHKKIVQVFSTLIKENI